MRTRRSIVATILASAFVVATAGLATATVDEATVEEADEARVPTKKVPKVKVSLVEFQVNPALQFVAKGKIKFAVKNAGTEKHEFVILRGADPAALPTKADGSVDEEQIPKSDEVGELENIKKGKTKSKTFKLSAGSYILLCNTVDTEEDGTVVSHFARGMYTVINAS
jgi:iron uptake system EfeUOB component EfeO/EfeM